jgi:hypothetical protein
MNVRFQEPEVLEEQLAGDLTEAKKAAEDLTTALSLLDQMQDICLGMGFKIGSRNYTVLKKDDFFVFFVEEH